MAESVPMRARNALGRGLRVVVSQLGSTTTIRLEGRWDLAVRNATREAIRTELARRARLSGARPQPPELHGYQRRSWCDRSRAMRGTLEHSALDRSRPQSGATHLRDLPDHRASSIHKRRVTLVPAEQAGGATGGASSSPACATASRQIGATASGMNVALVDCAVVGRQVPVSGGRGWRSRSGSRHPTGFLVPVCGDPASVLDHPREVHQVPCQERRVAVGEIVLRSAGAGSR